MTTQSFPRRPSLFWPLLLIGVGLLWLLVNIGLLQPTALEVLFQLWPLVLIVIGLELVVGRTNPQFRLWIGVGGVALIAVLMLVGPALGIVSIPQIKEGDFAASAQDVTAATVNLDLSVAETHITALADSDKLVDADLHYLGDIRLDNSGGATPTVTLSNTTPSNNFSFTNFFGLFNNGEKLRWDIGLSSTIPMALDVVGGVGGTTLDLNGLNLTRFHESGGVGSVDLTLPSTDDGYDAEFDAGTGSATITIADNAALDFTIKGGVGSIVVNLPDDAAVKLDAHKGLGAVNVPASYQHDGDTWQTADFDQSDRQIILHYEGGVGSLTLH